jgi:quinoprotein glucose dehydrogenase
MRTTPPSQALARRHARWLCVGFVAAAAACQPRPQPRARVPPAPLPSEPVPAFEAAAVTLDPAQAQTLARSVGEEVTARLAEGLSLSLWAPEQLIADPIAISLDSLGRAFVTRTARTDQAEIDIRGHRDWMVESITFRTVEDKRNFYLRELAPERSAENEWLEDYNSDGSRDWRDLTVHKEKVYRIEDRSGDGIADHSQVVLEGFNDVVSDVAHGILAYDDQLILTLSPDIWRLRDENGDGVIDSRSSIAHGSGIHIGFGGHGLSNPIIGPDGRLYWKMGDLGLDYETREGGRITNTMSGSVIRAEPDGSDMELFATGLRNPQEFAFDEYGNMITADNDGDHPGETERIVYITQGSDAGWRINWQFGKYVDPDNNTYKVWMDEDLYKPRFEGQAAYITPPVAAYHAGPSGLVFNPGTALSDAWDDYFFVSIFPGAPANARIHGFRLAEKGAGFELAEDKEMLRGVLAVGIDFGPDGALYLTDWTTGWSPNDRGRIWKLDTPATIASAERAETKALIAERFDARPIPDLVSLLRHADMRVRTKAQFHLVNRGAARELLASARQTEHQLARVHAIWGIGQLARKDPGEARPLIAFLRDPDAEIRAQAAKVLGDVRFAPAAGALVDLLDDPADRPRFFAAEALGRLRHGPAVQPIVEMLRANDDRDVYLRQAGATALARIGDAAAVAALADDPSRAVRVAAVVALRRMRDAGVGRFVRDQDEYVVTEAARAINDDGGIEGALPDLAATLQETRLSAEPLIRRAINANLRVGSADAARRVAAYAARAGGPDTLRAEAIAVLGVWPAPSILDRVDGYHIGTATRDTTVARAALAAIVEPLFASGSPLVQIALADAVARLRLTEAAPALAAKVSDGQTPEVRIAALEALQRLGDPRVGDAVRAALQDQEERVRMAALGALTELDLPEATTAELLASMVGRGSVAEQQSALAALGRMQGETGREALTQLVNQLVEGDVDPAIQLDVAEAARATGHAPLVAMLERYDAARASREAVVAYADALVGGDARRGQQIVFQHPAAQCTRCHTIGQAAGANVGPPLRGIGSQLTREQILESLVAPSARIAPGFGVEGGPSAMPPMGGILTRREIRDVVEFLSNLR